MIKPPSPKIPESFSISLFFLGGFVSVFYGVFFLFIFNTANMARFGCQCKTQSCPSLFVPNLVRTEYIYVPSSSPINLVHQEAGRVANGLA
jgi:hypothetical protein